MYQIVSDIAIGAYESGHTILLRSHPAVDITATLKTVPEQIRINDTSPFQSIVCLSYSGIDAPEEIGQSSLFE
jgi:hypothetical protein